MNKRGINRREEIWIRAWCCVAAADNTVHKNIPAEWADECLRDFDERFKKEKS